MGKYFNVPKATFNGRHNKQKSKLLIVLYDRLKNLKKRGGLRIRELAGASGVSYDYLRARLTLLYGWGYIHRRIIKKYNRPIYRYTITKKGIRFVEKRIPKDKLQEYIREIQETTGNRGQNIKDLFSD
jgi:predicted ArsR family transcriptional regulator